MYGLVLQCIEGYVRQNRGDAVWENIRRRAGVEQEVFLGAEALDDSMVAGLIATTADSLRIPAPEVLHALGRHWILHTAGSAYGSLLDGSGQTFGDFIMNLPEFHSRVARGFPQLQPPLFSCRQHSPGRVLLHYRSHRSSDLAPFVVGMLDGLGSRFHTPIEVRHQTRRADGADHDEFLVAWSAQMAA